MGGGREARGSLVPFLCLGERELEDLPFLGVFIGEEGVSGSPGIRNRAGVRALW